MRSAVGQDGAAPSVTTKLKTLEELAELVPRGARLGIGGVHLSRLPMALIRAVLASGKKDFVFIGWGGGLPLELFLEAQAVRKLLFCFSSLDIFGLAPRFREAMEQGTIEAEEWTALAMMQGLHAAHFRLPEMPFQLPAGSRLMEQGDFWRKSPSTFDQGEVGQARRIDVDVLLLHVQRADRAGNVEIQGARGIDLALLGASQKVLVTAEEIVEVGVLGDVPKSFVLPRAFVTAMAHAPWGAWPTSCLPYYTTDYQELSRFTQAEQQRRRAAREGLGESSLHGSPGLLEIAPADRRNALSAAAAVDAEMLSASVLREQRAPVASEAWTIDELMAVALSREYDNQSICSVGSVSPLAMVSYLLAKKTHAPELTILALNGGFIDIDFHPMGLTLAEPLEFQSARAWWGADESYHWYYQQGRVTHEVITVAQIDRHGRTNNAWITQGDKRLRLPGQGGMADVANMHRDFTLYLARHTPERFVASVDFCTASRGLFTERERRDAGLQPGKVRLISDLGIFELDDEQRVFRLLSVHPGVTLEDVRAKSGGEFLVAESLQTTQPPTAEQLRQVREEIDPLGVRRLEFVASKDRASLIASILTAESALVEQLKQKGMLRAKTGVQGGERP